MNKLFLVVLTAVFSVCSYAQNLPADIERLSYKDLKPYSLNSIPTPVKQSQASLNWQQANRLYSDKGFSTSYSPRLDAAANYMVMLQGFHWYADSYWQSYPNGWWGVLADKAKEISKAGFQIIWFPPVSIGSYYPTEWYNFNSQWGKEEYLRKAISKMHEGGIYVLADVVLNHRNGTADWATFTNPDWPTTVIVQNDEWSGILGQPNNGKSSNYDEGQGEGGCRDLDHNSPIVREDTKIFMRWLKNNMGFDGWRFDMVKGFSPSRIKEYNKASMPAFTVGEVYDGNRQVVTSWIDGTDDSSSKADASSAFDFPTKFNLVTAVETERYELLNDNGKPSGLIGWWPSKSVTFVENHDTSPRDPKFIANASLEYKTQRMMGYAYIMTHPGIPCVFWPHFYDWGANYQKAITDLIKVRRKAGLNSASPMNILAAQNGLYASVITGDNFYLVLKLGKSWGWEPGPGWTLETSGERYAVWSMPVSKSK